MMPEKQHLDPCKYGKDMDSECVKLCDAINSIPGLITYESCCGHGKDTFRIWFTAKSMKCLRILLYYCMPCHVGFCWDVVAYTDCSMKPVRFCVRSKSVGDEAYREASLIASKILSFIQSKRRSRIRKERT